jgi:hypothetical protein
LPRRLALAAAVLIAAPAQAQELPLSVHGSLNAGYGRATDYPSLGIPLNGTADYRIATLQFRYDVSPEDQFVIQMLNRRVGSSPLATAVGDVTAQWAYWQHTAGDVKIKMGRAPLPRGLQNEVRYIGTVLPFFRVPFEYTGDAFDAVDGVVVSWRQALGSFSFEAHPFFGGTENRSVRSVAAGLTVRRSRANNMIGSQFYLDAPQSVRLGLHAARYDRVDSVQNGYRRFVGASGQWDPRYATFRLEHVRESGNGPASDIKTTYGQVVAKVSDRLRFAGEHTVAVQRIFGTAPTPNVDVFGVRSTGAAANWFFSGNTVLKLEHHWRSGYQFDAFTPPTTGTGAALQVNPPYEARYWLLSVALAF